MRGLLVRTVLAAAGIAAVGMLIATTALAHGAPYTVTAGSAPPSTTVAFTATSGTFKWLDTTTNVTVQCTSVRLTGTVTTGSGESGIAIATINGAATRFIGCTAPAGLTLAYTGVGTWYLDITDSTNGVSTGRLSNVLIHVASTNPNVACTFDLGSPTSSTGFTSSDGTIKSVPPGSQAFTYTNASSALDAVLENPGGLGMWNTHGAGTNSFCVTGSIYKQGNRWTVSQASLPLTVTSPAGAGPIAIS